MKCRYCKAKIEQISQTGMCTPEYACERNDYWCDRCKKYTHKWTD